ncbi:MAG: ATP-dependent DNA helicase RecG [Patescibacteria group bacterium]|nr:ATP-dependent DNA helicase RecG [Patescibacteria group bacterium]
MQKPQISLTTPISKISRVLPGQARALSRLGIETAGDLLYHFPVRYGDTAEIKNIGSLVRGETAVVFGKISKLKTSKGFRSKIPMGSAIVEDESGSVQCVWFNQPYLAKMFGEGTLVRIEGKVSQKKSKMEKAKWKNENQNLKAENEITVEYEDDNERAGMASFERPQAAGHLFFSNPKIEKVDKLPIGVGDSLFGANGPEHNLFPVYPESRGVSSNWIYHVLQKILKSGIIESLDDPLPKEILAKYNLPSLHSALIWIHVPLKKSDAEAARKRFAFEEIFFIQLLKQATRRAYEANPAFSIETDDKAINEFVRRFPFPATEAQYSAIAAIIADMRRGKPMSRLLEGDVGSGKTAVAAAAAYAAVTSRPIGRQTGHLQVAYLCPTEILATQHFESFIQYFSYLGINVGLITGSGCRKFPSKVNPKSWTDISRTQLLKWVHEGDIPILIGTHAIIQKSVEFKHLAMAIIDEQHRFGTRQRAELVRKNTGKKAGIPFEATFAARRHEKEPRGEPAATVFAEKGVPAFFPHAPHLLSMTATPIPRTLALTLYGDLDLTLLDQMPAGRKPVKTEIVTPTKRADMYEKIRDELTAGRQAYVICPRIDEPDPDKELALEAKSVKAEAKRLKKSIFPDREIGVLHSKMKPDDKDRVMLDFKAGKIDILCATSVVEVGVNVPNATMIVIEGAERFGLAQLHQLRGRVIRSEHQAYCFVIVEKAGGKTLARLKNFTRAKNGFELAEFDLALRGAGDLSGLKQWGISDIAMEALKNLKMVEAARTEAAHLLDTDPTFTRFPLVKKELEKRKSNAVHFE